MLHSFFNRPRWVLLFLVAFIALLLSLVWQQLAGQWRHDRAATIAEAIQRNTNLTVSLEQYAIRTLQNADALLQQIGDEYREKGAQINLAAFTHTQFLGAKECRGVAIFDTTGALIVSDRPMLRQTAQGVAGADFFRVHQAGPAQLYLSTPQFAPAISDTVIVLSRPLRASPGRRGGVMALYFKPTLFTRIYANANMRPHDLISFVAPNAITYARRRGSVESYGESIRKSPLWGYLKRNPVGHYFARDALFGVPTYFSYRKLESYPLVVTAGSSAAGVLAEFEERKAAGLQFGIGVSLLSLLFFVLVVLFYFDRKKFIGRLASSEARYRSIFENNRDALLVMSPDGRLAAMNRSAFQLFQTADAPPQHFHELFLSVTPQVVLAQNEAGVQQQEVAFVCNGGHSFIGELEQATYRTAEGRLKVIVAVRDVTQRRQMEQRLLSEEKRHQRVLTKQIILAQEQEREAIGYELHDNVNQILTTVKLYLETGKDRPDLRPDLIDKSIFYVNQSICEIRDLSHKLSAPTLGTQSLVDSIKALVDMVASAGNIRISFHHQHGHSAVSKEHRLAIYRILQEQLNNIVKHARATQVFIRLEQTSEAIEISIEDDGIGFSQQRKGKGIGLNNMRSRAKAFGGNMHISTEEGKGCRVFFSLPLHVREEPA